VDNKITMKKSKLVSVCIIAQNCADTIGATLKWATENFEEVNIVYDPENYDSTVGIISKYDVITKVRKFDNFRDQKQHALDMATRPWVLSVDTDEVFEDDVPFDNICSRLERSNKKVASFNLINLQKSYMEHISIDPKARLISKTHAKMLDKIVDTNIDTRGLPHIHFPFFIIHFGHLRKKNELILKGKQKLEYANSDKCDGNKLKETSGRWFYERNKIWDEQTTRNPSNVVKSSEKYLHLIDIRGEL
jgi:hypothetical protein